MTNALRIVAAMILFSLADPLAAQEASSPGEIIEKSPADAWRSIPAENLLVGTLMSGDHVVIELAPQFAPRHVENVRSLALAGWWDGTAINRVQDNFVVQWGGATIELPPPAGVPTTLPAEYEIQSGAPMTKITEVHDASSASSGFVDGWPVSEYAGKLAPVHCYGTLGAGRENPPDTGWGSELYVVIGQPPRQLDRNMAVVGRVVEGMEFLSGLPRGRGAGGELASDQAPARWRSLVRADRLPARERPSFEFLDTASPTFARYATARTTYRNPFYLTPPGMVDICSVPVPVRRRETAGPNR
ncbi:peptidylprolyl isomerase [Sphingopyxis indica]|uniref:peptidylprolyl isomerase n=1 Tax=Sphingopyxis indica TaxID=436663 RepID=UPI002938EF3D|nr:peptidylprolyl isomerase [Sphingopyxis indica]WOF43050.1 peptidylprolyl isomerase [Sphingopyxis indica]